MATPSRLTVKQVADQTRIPVRTLQHAIATGELKAQQVPGYNGPYLIAPSALRRYLAKREAKASA